MRIPQAIGILVWTISALILADQIVAEDWLHWRGPEQTGISRAKNLIGEWDYEKRTNILWESKTGGRSTPIIMNGRLYINCRTLDDVNDPVEKVNAQEQVVCFDAKTGEELWRDRFNVFQTDIAAPRVGWASMAGDSETGYVYMHSVSGLFRCYDKDGKVVWEHSLYEEYGKISGYGGRTHTPVIDEDRVIVSYLAVNWGDMKGPAPKHFYYAFNKKTGELQWITAPGGRPKDTTYACPIVKVIEGQRTIIAPNADGGVYAMNARTGKKLWGHVISLRGLNTSPVMEGDKIFVTHGEDNIDNVDFGSVRCYNTKGEQIWRTDGIKSGYGSPLVKDGVLYCITDTGSMVAVDAENGEKLWEHTLGTVGKGSPIWADGKIYVMEVDGNIHCLDASKKGCKTISHVELLAIDGRGKDEIYASPAIADGRIYFCTRDRLICIGEKDSKVEYDPIPKEPAEGNADKEVDHIQIRPYEVALKVGETASFEVHAFDAMGRFIESKPAKIALGETLTGAAADGATLNTKDVKSNIAGMITGEYGGKTAQARVRVFTKGEQSWDFNSGKTDPTWIRSFKKLFPKDDGDEKVMRMGPGKARPSHTVWLGTADQKNYTVQADVKMIEAKRRLPNVGLTNQRYNFILQGQTGKLSIQSWAAHLRMAKRIRFRSDPDIWYTMKMQVEVKDGKAHVRGKVWKRTEDEPAEWTVEAVDPNPNLNGSPGLYVYALSDAYFDNVKVTPGK